MSDVLTPPRVLPFTIALAAGLTLAGLGACGTSAPPRPVAAEHPASVSSTPLVDPKAAADLAEGERRIEVAAGDCAAACAGLATITRARLKLCAPRTSACDDAERRDEEATKKVTSFCGPCPKVEP